MEFLTNNLGLLLGGGSGTVALWVLKKIPNEKIQTFVFNTFYRFGVVATLGFSKWKITKSLWNKTFEPYLIDGIENIFSYAVKGLVKGLRSDN